ncbi:NAD(P)/FAD-dependent oxidoreductase [Streptomyces spinoverrucosus]|uniref:flavin-containing monooxygenase n=1 Tax=Streptomyces spinoverrucosus TaxID=284043 RepID=UPI0018C43CA3|nr:NAD(P)/FAD-dependent oxidoreductase [Streptomyces spinoverrucosus]MBG0854478.1 NAD(P)/FAD-dependent oxidoreductase [Streptomyces spinoverrucosus]
MPDSTAPTNEEDPKAARPQAVQVPRQKGSRTARQAPPADRPVYVIGAGPGGLAAAHALRARGIRAVVLEKSDSVGASWRRHYDRLHLHTTRRLSALPGLPMPRRFGRWVSRDDVVRYLEKYAEHHELEIVTGVEVSRVERAPDGTGWLLHATGGRRLTGGAVVVATGYNHTPRIPDWPGRDTYTGELLHASAYRNPAPYAGRDVLVVGVGNTGAEIAVDLVEGGASHVRLSVRTAPHIVRRSTAGWAAQYTGVLVRRLPVGLVDRLARPMAKVSVPDLAEHGLPRPDTGLYSRVTEGSIPVQDVGLIDAVRKGKVEIVAAVDAFDGDKVVLADGDRIGPDAVIAATGYVRALDPLLGHLDVLDSRGKPVTHGARTPKNAPDLYFTGFTNPISGMLRELAIDAEKIARAVARRSADRVSRLPG